MKDVTDKGWLFPHNHRKAHYYRADGRSLCGKYGAFGTPNGAFDPDNGKPTKDDCAACRRKLDKDGVK